ncbi:uncharacterized protein ANIA_11575 [Aspergillus nidulans FGSC A4]|uniref:DUF1212 domain membrane protein (AFU_orthologue AFUA_5G07620) n=1 Tax=Emericella nidulans (strain FGSC A4 / ATCC 38163 / CBS 112.46 / NRRL 194 / M139) TaxID=227321 RepID=C8VDW7_EMENI|nr:hypothetical protein [Aspergillus nidulans FGSC A4]CBF80216.1 TPA: DUF1212 domain membrane protein (AFU_orthologue; AFUA_5G07620) [Aspergillus nidulans FGSC A4]
MIYQKEKQKTTRYFSQSGGSLTGSEGQQKAREHEELAQEAMAWILVVGHALNLVLNKVSATSVYSLGIAAW